MFYKVGPFGYFSRVSKVSKGPWFNEYFVEEDGLEYFYMFSKGNEVQYLLSNNISWEDRERLQGIYYAMQRNNALAWFGGVWLGAETIIKCSYFRKMAPGWRFVSLVGFAALYKQAFTAYNSVTYGPIVSAFLRKYLEQAKTDKFDIVDRKREFYEIDTSQYMNYTNEDLGHEYHTSHGPQPVLFILEI